MLRVWLTVYTVNPLTIGRMSVDRGVGNEASGHDHPCLGTPYITTPIF